MKLFNLVGALNQAKHNLKNLCVENGFVVDPIDFDENINIFFKENDVIQIYYVDDNLIAYTIAHIKNDSINFIESVCVKNTISVKF